MDVDRRTVLQAGGLVAVGGVVAACSAGGSESTAATSAPPATAPAASTAPTAGPSTGSSGGAGVAQVADIPVGGGLILDDESVVITQPAAGEIKAFSAICTHQGCLVGDVTDNEIICPCHGSRFSAVDGSVTQGPAMVGLAEAPVRVEGDSVVLG